MSLSRSRSNGIRRRIVRGGTRQLAVVVGYSCTANSLETWLYLACGTMPSGLLRYSGKTLVSFASDTERRDFGVRMHSMKRATRHPLLASPFPAHMVPISPRLLVEVSHHGWSEGGLMHDIALESFRSLEAPAPCAHDPAG